MADILRKTATGWRRTWPQVSLTKPTADPYPPDLAFDTANRFVVPLDAWDLNTLSSSLGDLDPSFNGTITKVIINGTHGLNLKAGPILGCFHRNTIIPDGSGAFPPNWAGWSLYRNLALRKGETIRSAVVTCKARNNATQFYPNASAYMPTPTTIGMPLVQLDVHAWDGTKTAFSWNTTPLVTGQEVAVTHGMGNFDYSSEDIMVQLTLHLWGETHPFDMPAVDVDVWDLQVIYSGTAMTPAFYWDGAAYRRVD